MTIREDIFGKTESEIRSMVEGLKLPSYSARQITDWLYRKQARSFDDMTNLPKEVRKSLDASYIIGRVDPAGAQESADGTKKYLYPVTSGKFVEAVFIPDQDRATLCLSSQVGCKMGCVFCMTGKQGFQGNLSAGEIINQVVSLPEAARLTNYVFMGMGEPLANTENVLRAVEILTADYAYGISPSRITISTIGMLPGLEQVLTQSRCHIAISLHSPFDAERLLLMPVEKVYPAKRVVEYLKKNLPDRQRRISFEYILFKGINDTPRHVNGLTRLLNGLRCRINLIRFHPIPGTDLQPSDEETIAAFKNRLNEKGILTTIRASRGQDIFAACGMLSTNSKLITG
jgi:23S rRNA (adenine2503-C2)-methyltransferase